MTKLGTLELELKLLKNEFDAEMRRLNGQVQAFEDKPALKPKVDTKEVVGAKRDYQSLNSEHSKTAQAINSNVISPVFDGRSLRQAVVDIKTLRKELQGLKADIGSSIIRTHLEHSVLVNNQSVIGEMRIGNTRITTGLKEIQLEIKAQKQGVFSAAIGSIFSGFFGGIGMSGGLRMGRGVQATMGVDFGDLGKGVGADLNIKIQQLKGFLDFLASDVLAVPEGIEQVGTNVKKKIDSLYKNILDPSIYAEIEDFLVRGFLAKDSFGKSVDTLTSAQQRAQELFKDAQRTIFQRFVVDIQDGLQEIGAAVIKTGAIGVRMRKRIINNESAQKVMGQAGLFTGDFATGATRDSIEKSDGILFMVGGTDPKASKPGAPKTDTSYWNAGAMQALLPNAHVETVTPYTSVSVEHMTSGLYQKLVREKGGLLDFIKNNQEMLGNFLTPKELEGLITNLGQLHPFETVFDQNFDSGYNQDSLRLASKVIAAGMSFPDKPLNIGSVSGGGVIVEEAINIINEIAKMNPQLEHIAQRVRGFGTGMPMAGLSTPARPNDLAKFMSFVGTFDQLAKGYFGSAIYEGENVPDELLRELESQFGLPSGYVKPTSPLMKMISGWGEKHDIPKMLGDLNNPFSEFSILINDFFNGTGMLTDIQAKEIGAIAKELNDPIDSGKGVSSLKDYVSHLNNILERINSIAEIGQYNIPQLLEITELVKRLEAYSQTGGIGEGMNLEGLRKQIMLLLSSEFGGKVAGFQRAENPRVAVSGTAVMKKGILGTFGSLSKMITGENIFPGSEFDIIDPNISSKEKIEENLAKSGAEVYLPAGDTSSLIQFWKSYKPGQVPIRDANKIGGQNKNDMQALWDVFLEELKKVDEVAGTDYYEKAVSGKEKGLADFLWDSAGIAIMYDQPSYREMRASYDKADFNTPEKKAMENALLKLFGVFEKDIQIYQEEYLSKALELQEPGKENELLAFLETSPYSKLSEFFSGLKTIQKAAKAGGLGRNVNTDALNKFLDGLKKAVVQYVIEGSQDIEPIKALIDATSGISPQFDVILEQITGTFRGRIPDSVTTDQIEALVNELEALGVKVRDRDVVEAIRGTTKRKAGRKVNSTLAPQAPPTVADFGAFFEPDSIGGISPIQDPTGGSPTLQVQESAPEEASLASVVGGIQSFHDSFNEFVQWMKSSGKSSGPPPANPDQRQGGGLTRGNDTDPDIFSSGVDNPKTPGGGGVQEVLVTAGQAVRQATAVGIDKAENLTSAITQTGPGKIATALGTVGLGAGIAQLTGVGNLTADMVQDAVMWAINSVDAEMQSAILNHITQFGDSVGDLVRTAVTTAFPIELDPTVIPEAPPSGVMGHITDAMRNLNNMKNGALQQIVEGMVQTLQDALGGTAQGTANIVGSLIDIPEEQIALVVADVFRAIVDISIGGSGAMLLNKGYRGLSGRALPELNVMREGRPDALLPQEVRLDAADAYARVNKIATELAGDPGPERSGELIQELGTALRELGKAKSRLAKLADEEAGQAIAMIKALEQRAMAVQAEILARNPDIAVKKMDSIAKSLSPGAEFQSYLEQAKQSGIYNQDIASSRKTAGRSLQTRLTKDEAVELQKMFRSDEGIKQLMTSLLDTSVAEVMPQSGLLPDVAIAQTRKQVATLAKAMIATFKQEGSLDGISLDILSGLLKDLVAGKGKLSKEGKALAETLPDTFRKVLGIASPSKVFMEIGKNLVEGLAQGFTMKQIFASMTAEMKSELDKFTDRMEVGTIANTIDIPLQLQGADVEERIYAVATALEYLSDLREASPVNGDQKKALEQRERARRQASIEFRIKEQGVQANFADDDLPSIAVGEDLNAVEQAAQQLANLLQNAGLLSFLGMGNDITSFGGNTGIPSRDENALPTVIPPPGAGQPTPEENKIRQLLDWLKKATGIVDPLSGDGFDSALEVPIKTTVTTGESSQIPTIVVAQGGSDVAIEEEIPTGVNANQSAANVAEKLNEVFTSAQESLGNIPPRARALGNSLWNSLLTAFESAVEALGLTEQALQLQSALGLDTEVTAVSSSTGINTSLPTEINTSLPTEVNSSSAQVNTTGNISIPITGPGAPSAGSASVTAPTSSGRIPPTIPSPTGGGSGGSTPPPPPPAPPGSGGLSSSTPTGGNSGSLSSPLSTPTAPLTGPGTSAGTPTGTGSNTSTSSSSASSGQTTTTTTTSTTTTGASQGTTTRTNTNVSAPLPTAPTSGVSGSTPPPPTLPPTTPNSAPTPTPPSPQNPTGAGGTGGNSTGGGSRPTPPPLSSIPPIPPNYMPVGGSGGSGGSGASTPSSGAGSGPASGGSNPGSGSTPPPPQNPTGASGNPDDDGDFWTRVQRAWFNTIDQPRQGVANINPDEAIRINDSVANGTIGVLDNITEALRLVGITVERTGAFFDELGEKFPLVAEIGGILKDIGIGILSLLGLGAIDQMITDFAQSSIQSAVQIERFKSALLFSPSEMPTTSLKELSKFTKEIGADFLVAAESYTKLVVASSGSNVAPQVESIYKGFQSALTAQGATPDEQQRAFLAVEQIIGKNQIMAEELRGQLAEVMPQALGALSRSLGVTNEELNQMLQTTRLLPETTLMKLAYQLEAESSVAGASIREGVLGDINRTRATAQQIQVGVGQTLLGAADVNLNPMGLVDDTSSKVSPFKIFNFGFEALEKSIGTLTFSLTTLVAVIGFKMVGAIMKAATGMRLFQMASATLGVDLVKSKMLVDLYNNSLTRLGAKQAVVGTSRYNVLRGASILGAGAMGLAKAFAPFLAIGVVMDQITKRLSAQNTEMKKLRIETEKTLSKLIEYGDKAGSLNFQGRRNQDLPTQWFTGNQLSEDWAYNRLTGDQNPLLRFLMGGPASLLSPGRLPQQNLWDMSGYVPYLDADGNKRVERLTREEYVANKTDIEELGKFINIMDQTTKQLFSNISDPGVMQNNQNVMRGLEVDLLKKQNEINLEKSTTADPVKIQQLQSELSRIQEDLVKERDKRFGNEQINAQQLEFLNRAEETAKNTIQDEDLKQETLKRIRMEREIRLMLQDAYRESAGALDFNIVAFQRSLGLLNTALTNASADLQLRFNVATNTITGQRVGLVPEGQGLRDDEIERLLAQNEVIRADQAVRNTQAVIGQATKNLYEQPYLMEAAGVSLGSIPELFNPATGKPYEDPLEAAMRSDKETLNALLENKALQPVVQNYIRAMLVFKDLQELLTSQQGELNQVSRENLRLQEERMLLIRNANTDMASANTRRMMNEMVLNGDLGMQDLPLLEIQARLEEVKERIQTAYGQLALGIDPAVVMPEIANLLAEQSDLEVQARQAQFDLERAVGDQANSVMDFNYSLIQSAMNNARTIRDFWWRVEDTQIQLQREARGLEESWTDLMFGLETQLIDAQNELNRAQNQLEETRASFALESTSPFSQSRGRRVGEIINSMIAELNNSESEIDNLDSQQRQIGQEYIQSLRSIRDEQERQLDAERQRTRTLVQLNEEYQMMLMDMHNQVRTMYAQFANLFAELMMNNPAMAGQLQNPASFNLIPTPYAPQFGGNGFLPPPPFSGVAPQAIGPGGQVNPYYFQQMQAYRQGMGGMGSMSGFYQDPYAYQQRVKTPEEIRAEIAQQLSQPPMTPPPARVSETKYPVRNGSGISGYFTADEIRQMGIPQSQVGEGVRPTQSNYLDQVMQNNLSGRPLTMSSRASNTALVASSVPIQAPGTGSARIQAYEPLLALIRSGEGGYGSYNRGRAGDSGGQTLEKLFGKPLSQITVNEIIKKQAQSSLFAVGAYQFIPSTLKSAASRTGLGNAPFTPQTQALLAIDLINNKRPEIGRFIASQGSGNFREAIQGLAREWASIGLAYPEAGRRAGQSRYAGTGGNAASISPDRAGNALLEVVRRLQQFGLRSSAGGASGAGGNMAAGGPSLNFGIPESIELGQTAQNAIEKGLLWLFNDVVRPAANFVRPNNQIAPFTWDDITPEKPQPSQPPATQKPPAQSVTPTQSKPNPVNILIPPANANNIPAGATPGQIPQTTEQILNWLKTNTGRQSFPVQGLGEQMPFSTQGVKDKIPLEPGRVFINPQRQQGLYDQYQVQPIQTFEGMQVIDPNTVPAFPVQDTTRANEMAGQIADARTQANRTDQERVRIAQMATMLRGTNQLRELALEFERADRQIYYGIYDYNLDLAGLRAAKKGYETAAEQVDAVGRDIRRDFDNRARNFQEQVESIDIELTGYAQAFSVIRDELAKSDVTPERKAELQEMLRIMQEKEPVLRNARDLIIQQWQATNALANETERVAKARRAEEIAMQTQMDYANKFAQLFDTRASFGATNAMGFGTLINPAEVIKARAEAAQALRDTREQFRGMVSDDELNRLLEFQKEINQLNIDQAFVRSVPGLQAFGSEMKSVILNTKSLGEALLAVGNNILDMIVERMTVLPLQRLMGQWLGGVMGLDSNYTYPLYSSEFAQDQLAKTSSSGAVATQIAGFGIEQIMGTNASISLERFKDSTDKASDSLVNTLAVSAIDATLSEAASLAQFTIALQVATAGIYQFVASLGVSTVGNGIGSAVGSVFGNPGNIASTVFGFAKNVFLPTFNDGGFVDDEIPTLSNGGMAGGGAIAKAMDKERQLSGKRPVLAVINEAEYVIPAYEAQSYLQWRDIKATDVKNYAAGGFTGKAPEIRGNPPQQGKTVINNFTQSNTFKVANSNDVGRSASQANRQQLLDAQRNKLL